VNELRTLLASAEANSPGARRKVLRQVMVRADSQQNIAHRAGISNGSASTVISDLRDPEKNLLAFEQKSRFSGTDIVRMAKTRGVALGLELGYQSAIIVGRRVDQDFGEAEIRRIATRSSRYTSEFEEELWTEISDICAQLNQDPSDIATLGVGVPRMVNAKDQSLAPPLLPPWDTRQEPLSLLSRLFRSRLGPGAPLPHLAMDNDANLGALGEFIYGGYGKGDETFVYVKASTGIGAGILIGMQHLRGNVGAAGEIGHTVMRRDGAVCLCGGRGCLETLVGERHLIDQAEAVRSHRTGSGPRRISELVTAAAAGNLVYRRILEDAATTLGTALGNLCNVLNPNVIVLGGTWGRSPAPEILLEPCRAALRSTALTAASAGGELLRPARIEDATAYGALAMALLGAPTAAGAERRPDTEDEADADMNGDGDDLEA
jgi:predicted NBD/HSP70 family sugar kinase